jgi:hypothetical protein
MVLFPALLFGQTCHGTARLDDERPIQIGATFGFADATTTVSGNITAGSTVFVSGTGGWIGYDGIDESGSQVGVTVGVQVPADSSKKLIICPEGGLVKQFGVLPAIGGGGGVSIGAVAMETPNLQIVPNGGINVIRARYDFGTFTASDTFGAATLGAGFVMKRRISLVPAVVIAFGQGNTTAGFTMGLSFSLGR